MNKLRLGLLLAAAALIAGCASGRGGDGSGGGNPNGGGTGGSGITVFGTIDAAVTGTSNKSGR